MLSRPLGLHRRPQSNPESSSREEGCPGWESWMDSHWSYAGLGGRSHQRIQSRILEVATW